MHYGCFAKGRFITKILLPGGSLIDRSSRLGCQVVPFARAKQRVEYLLIYIRIQKDMFPKLFCRAGVSSRARLRSCSWGFSEQKILTY